MQSPFDTPLSGIRSPFAGRRLGTAVSALAAYAVATFTPKLVFDFETETYATGGAVSTFDDSITYTGDSLKTMVDSDGVLKWAPHNIAPYSEDLTQWTGVNATGIENGNEFTITDDATDGAHVFYKAYGNFVEIQRVEVELKAGTGRYAYLSSWNTGNPLRFYGAIVDLQTGAITKEEKGSSGFIVLETATSVVSKEGGWHLVSFNIFHKVVGDLQIQIGLSDTGTSTFEDAGTINYIGSGNSIQFRYPRVYRSDLGGMVNNPDRGDSYVPTTDSPVYLPRRGHHVYDGTSYVNEGLLVESEARTNVLLNNRNLTSTWNASASLVQDKVGLDGIPNKAWTIADADSSNFQNVFKSLSVPDDTNTHTQTIYILKDENESRFPRVDCELSGGTSEVDQETKLNTKTGETFFSSLVADSVNVYDFGLWWQIVTVITNNGTGNTGLTTRIWPAVSTTLSGGTSSTATGSTVYDFGQVELNASTPSSPIPTAGAALTRDGESRNSNNLTYDSAAMWFTLDGAETYADEDTAGQVTLFDWRVDANDRITLTLDTDGAETGKITLTMVSGGTSWTIAADYLSPGILQSFSIAWRVTSSEINLAVGGTAATAVSVTSIPDLSTATASFSGNGTRELLRQGDGDIGDSGIEEASA